jgi:teichuronic acid biosynthesis glycosyltransferase TuaH
MRHVALHLSRQIPVLWVDPPISYLTPLNDRNTAAALRRPRLRVIQPGIIRLTPVTPPGVTRPVMREAARLVTRDTVRRALRRIGATVRAVVVDSLIDLLDVAPDARRVFYGTDDFVAGAELMGVSRLWLEQAERRQLAKAHVVVGVSPVLVDRWRAMGAEPVLVPNGVDAAHFADCDTAPLPEDVHLTPPIAGFVGHLSDRIDLAYLEAVADRDISILLVGPRQATFEIKRLDALLSRPNVEWVGPKAFADLPSYLRMIDVGLTPYTNSVFNQASFPLKTLEYLAAGRGAVSTELPATRWLDTDLIRIGASPAEFAEATAIALAVTRTDRLVAARHRFAAGHAWSVRTEQLAVLCGLPVWPGADDHMGAPVLTPVPVVDR